MSTTGDKILSILESRRGECVSGEELATKLSLSRSAIWKAVGELRGRGHSITAVTNRGYSLSSDDDVLSPEGILAYLPQGLPRDNIFIHKSLPSTNQSAKELAISGAPEGTAVLADNQTAGRGRLGRSFFSPMGGGVYLSLILRPKLSAQNAGLVTTAAAVAVCRAIERVTGISPGIKWVNDIYLQGKKVCGILTEAGADFESQSVDYIVLGIGVNTSYEDFPEELAGIAGAISLDKGKGQTRNRLAAEIISSVFDCMGKLNSGELLAEYRRRSVVIGREIQILRGVETEKATALDIDNMGGLVVRTEDGEVKTLNSGEISIRGDFK